MRCHTVSRSFLVAAAGARVQAHTPAQGRQDLCLPGRGGNRRSPRRRLAPLVLCVGRRRTNLGVVDVVPLDLALVGARRGPPLVREMRLAFPVFVRIFLIFLNDEKYSTCSWKKMPQMITGVLNNPTKIHDPICAEIIWPAMPERYPIPQPYSTVLSKLTSPLGRHQCRSTGPHQNMNRNKRQHTHHVPNKTSHKINDNPKHKFTPH